MKNLMTRDNRKTVGIFIVAGIGAILAEKALKPSISKGLKVKL